MKDFKAIVSEHLTKQHSEKRFVVVIKLEKDLDRIEDKAYRQARKMLKK